MQLLREKTSVLMTYDQRSARVCSEASLLLSRGRDGKVAERAITLPKPGHYNLKRGRATWHPTPEMRRMGFKSVSLGQDSDEARRRGAELERAYQEVRPPRPAQARQIPSREREGPPAEGTFADIFERFVRSETFSERKPRTKENTLLAWRHIDHAFGDRRPEEVLFEEIDQFYWGVVRKRGKVAARRMLLLWRFLYKLLPAFGVRVPPFDPSRPIRMRQAPPRHQTWREGEVVRLVKEAIRSGQLGLACVMAVAWDTQFSPVDVRGLTEANLFVTPRGLAFMGVSRAKTDAKTVGTLSWRTQRLLLDCLRWRSSLEPPPEQLFVTPRGKPFTRTYLAQCFRRIKRGLWLGDERCLMDMRRSGACEASIGGATLLDIAAKMSNDIESSRQLQRTYLQADLISVFRVDDARRSARAIVRDMQSARRLEAVECTA